MTTITAPFTGQHTEFHISPSISGTLSANTKVGEVDDLGSLEISRNVVDLLSYGDEDLRKLVTTKDNGSLAVTLSWAPGDTDHDALTTAFLTGAVGTYAIQWTSGTDTARADFNAYVTKFGISHPKDDKVSCALELIITGAVTFDLTPA